MWEGKCGRAGKGKREVGATVEGQGQGTKKRGRGNCGRVRIEKERKGQVWEGNCGRAKT